MSAPRVTGAPPRRTRIRRDGSSRLRRLGRWRKSAHWILCKFSAAPSGMRIFVIAATILAVFSATNFAYHVVRQPTELFFPVSGAFNKKPAQTWQQYAPLFREYSTAAITPELLAALAQVESAGNPLASTYWRWGLTWNPFTVYEPASSAVGMYQMTDAALAEARRYCIYHHTVVEEGCPLEGLYTRVVPSHAIVLTAVFLDRNVTAILSHQRSPAASPQKKQEVAAIIHLCGPASAKAFVRHGFYLTDRERCGDHDVATYLAQVNMLKQEFLRLAADKSSSHEIP